ncbi:hypothetical protein MHYP_G00302210 [Metynnis hypsauchen]
MIGIEKVMETEFLCPCKPVLNQLLAAFMFIAPALLAFIIMLFLVRPCKHCSCSSCRKCCAKAFLPCLIPPVAWVIMLLLDGQYMACGLTFEQGNYISDKDDPPVKWCQSNSSDETVEKQLHQQIVGLSKTAVELQMKMWCKVLCEVRRCVYDRSSDGFTLSPDCPFNPHLAAAASLTGKAGLLPPVWLVLLTPRVTDVVRWRLLCPLQKSCDVTPKFLCLWMDVKSQLSHFPSGVKEKDGKPLTERHNLCAEPLYLPLCCAFKCDRSLSSSTATPTPQKLCFQSHFCKNAASPRDAATEN